MKKMLGLLILVGVLFSLGPGSPAAQPARAAASWVRGLYTGWVYFMAKTDYDYNQSMEGASVTFAGAKFFQSHGDIECMVFDEAGTGHCAANFPLDIVNDAFGSFTSPDCSGTMQVSSRANAINGGPALAPLTNAPLDQGFSMSFNPLVGPESGTISMTTSGCPGGGTSAFQMAAGLPKWPQLDFYVEYHTALTIGGTCSMEGLPRSISTGPGNATLSLDQCEWRALYMDPYATLP